MNRNTLVLSPRRDSKQPNRDNNDHMSVGSKSYSSSNIGGGSLPRGSLSGRRTGSKSQEAMVESLKKQHRLSTVGAIGGGGMSMKNKLQKQTSSLRDMLSFGSSKSFVSGRPPSSLEITVHLHQGQGLVAKDCFNLLTGKDTSSDPYVKVSILTHDAELDLGTSKTCFATLNPVWNEILTKTFPYKETFKSSDQFFLKLQIMDYDLCKEDDPMGTIKIPLTVGNSNNNSHGNKATGGAAAVVATPKWYDVPANSALGASGKLELAIETQLNYSSNNSRTSVAAKTATGLVSEAANFVFGFGTAAANSIADAGAAVLSSTVEDTTTTAAASEKDEEEEPIYGGEEPVLQVNVTVHQGDGLVAKDRDIRSILGRKNNSDPYVVAEIWPKGIPTPEEEERMTEITKAQRYPTLCMGRSHTFQQSLSPSWEYTFDQFSLPMDEIDMEEAQLRLRIKDDDFGMKEDDPMGHVDIYLQPRKHMEIKKKWYHVSATSASRASGRVEVSLESNPTTVRKVIGWKKKKQEEKPVKEEVITRKPQVQSTNDEPTTTTCSSSELSEDPEMSASMPTRPVTSPTEDVGSGGGGGARLSSSEYQDRTRLSSGRSRASISDSRRKSKRPSAQRREGKAKPRESVLRRNSKPMQRETSSRHRDEMLDDSKTRRRSRSKHTTRRQSSPTPPSSNTKALTSTGKPRPKQPRRHTSPHRDATPKDSKALTPKPRRSSKEESGRREKKEKSRSERPSVVAYALVGRSDGSPRRVEDVPCDEEDIELSEHDGGAGTGSSGGPPPLRRTRCTDIELSEHDGGAGTGSSGGPPPLRRMRCTSVPAQESRRESKQSNHHRSKKNGLSELEHVIGHSSSRTKDASTRKSTKTSERTKPRKSSGSSRTKGTRDHSDDRHEKRRSKSMSASQRNHSRNESKRKLREGGGKPSTKDKQRVSSTRAPGQERPMKVRS